MVRPSLGRKRLFLTENKIMTNETEKQTSYSSLHDISMRKEELLKQIRHDQQQMGGMWNEMFRPQQRTRKKVLNLQSMLNTGIGVLDGALFAWKLYRKFKR